MIRHVVLLTFDENTPSEQREQVARAVRHLLEAIPEVLHAETGIDTGGEPGSAHLALIVDCADEAAYRLYDAHPNHVKATESVGGLVANHAALRYVV